MQPLVYLIARETISGTIINGPLLTYTLYLTAKKTTLSQVKRQSRRNFNELLARFMLRKKKSYLYNKFVHLPMIKIFIFELV